MNDRLKFRYFNKYSKKIVEPTNYENISAIYECLQQQVCFDENLSILPYDHIGNGLVFIQCTGLKDKNGKLIYEGDIVKINENYPDYSIINDFYKKQNFVVEYFQPQAVYLLKPSEYEDNSGDGIYDLSPDFYEFLNWKPTGKLEENTLQGIEILGNTYENPELLEVK